MFEWDEAKRLTIIHERALISGMRRRSSTTARWFTLHHGAVTRTALFQPLKSTASCTPSYGCGGAEISGLSHSGERGMAKSGRITSYTAKELGEKRKCGETRSDWAKAAAMTSEEIEAQVAADQDETGMVVDWGRVTVELPRPKADLHMRVDREVLDYFRSQGKGYQTRINAVLRSYVERMRQA
jgi:uncharacterized protein (DUF4415 family)